VNGTSTDFERRLSSPDGCHLFVSSLSKYENLQHCAHTHRLPSHPTAAFDRVGQTSLGSVNSASCKKLTP
jgi:hypothetical protein